MHGRRLLEILKRYVAYQAVRRVQKKGFRMANFPGMRALSGLNHGINSRFPLQRPRKRQALTALLVKTCIQSRRRDLKYFLACYGSATARVGHVDLGKVRSPPHHSAAGRRDLARSQELVGAAMILENLIKRPIYETLPAQTPATLARVRHIDRDFRLLLSAGYSAIRFTRRARFPCHV